LTPGIYGLFLVKTGASIEVILNWLTEFSSLLSAWVHYPAKQDTSVFVSIDTMEAVDS
jgi:hypothetical protein